MTPKDMMVVDANAEALGIPKSSLMENAGKCIAQNIKEILKPCKVAIFAGTGGNGGDGFVAARHLLNDGFKVDVFLLSHPSRIKSDETRLNWDVLQNISSGLNLLIIQTIEDSHYLQETDADVIVDALLGTGIKGKIKEPISSAIDIINKSRGIKIAVDVPSGLDPLTGQVQDKAVMADTTITFHKPKTGLKHAQIKFVGEMMVCDIGIPEEAEIFVGEGDLLRLEKRDIITHKGQNGKVLVVGGSEKYSGAPALAALSAIRSGVDLVYVASPISVSSEIRSYSPDLIVKDLSHDFLVEKDVNKILKLSKNVDAVVIGCGMGRENETKQALNELTGKIQEPVVADADALKILDETYIKMAKDIVLTPHSAEFKALFGMGIPEELEDKIDTILDVSRKNHCTILLKGVMDIIANGDKIRLNITGNPGMTVGGTGDCLAGLVGGLMAQGHDSFEASCLAAFINGRAGDLAAERFGYNFTASDLLTFISEAFK